MPSTTWSTPTCRPDRTRQLFPIVNSIAPDWEHAIDPMRPVMRLPSPRATTRSPQFPRATQSNRMHGAEAAALQAARRHSFPWVDAVTYFARGIGLRGERRDLESGRR